MERSKEAAVDLMAGEKLEEGIPGSITDARSTSSGVRNCGYAERVSNGAVIRRLRVDKREFFEEDVL